MDLRINKTQVVFISFLLFWIGIMVYVHYLADTKQVQGISPINLGPSDMLGHFILVGILGFFASLVGSKQFKVGKLPIKKLVVLAIILSLVEETTQLFRANRGFSFLDITANVTGILFFGAIGRRVKLFIGKWLK